MEPCRIAGRRSIRYVNRIWTSVDQDGLLAGRRRPAFGQSKRDLLCFFFLQIFEDFLDHRRLLDAVDDSHCAEQ